MPPKKNPATDANRAKRWCYTLNNPKQPIPWNELTQLYHVYGEEVGESGTPHYQGFVVFKNSKRLSNLKELNSVAHWEVARGSNKEASEYCKKDGLYHEFGELPEEQTAKAHKATSEKWREINDRAKQGDLHWIDVNHPKVWNQSYKNLKQIRTDHMERKKDLDGVCGIWYWGASGVGKTRLVTQKYPGAYLKRMNKWFDGYQHEDVVFLDDLEPSHSFMGYELKKLADRYCYMVEVKNDSMYIRPKTVVVTSQYPIKTIWKDDPEMVAALTRRFKEIHITKDNIATLLYLSSDEKLETPVVSSEDDSVNTIMDDSPTHASDIDEIDLQACDMIEAQHRENQRKQAMLSESLDKCIQKIHNNNTVSTYEKMPSKIRPPNVYFPHPPIKFTPPAIMSRNPKRLVPQAPKKLKRTEAFSLRTPYEELLAQPPLKKREPTLSELFDTSNGVSGSEGEEDPLSPIIVISDDE